VKNFDTSVGTSVFLATSTSLRSTGVRTTIPFSTSHLCRQARRLYVFRVFELPRAIAVETPQMGPATYLFARPPDMAFLLAYTRSTKEDIRQNRHNAAERLGFLGRIMHGVNARV
jgi:hypothetical protein